MITLIILIINNIRIIPVIMRLNAAIGGGAQVLGPRTG